MTFSIMQVTYDLLVGAEGVGSTVRAEMEKQVPGMSGQPSRYSSAVRRSYAGCHLGCHMDP